MGETKSRLITVEVISTVLLAVAAVATAWSGYQATRWNGEQAKTAGKVNAARIDAASAAGLANFQTQVDVVTFTQWVDAYAREETMLADFYFARFRPEFEPAVKAWLATRPIRNPGRSQDPLRDAGVPARCQRGVGTARCGG